MRTLEIAETNDVSGGTFGLLFGLLSCFSSFNCAPAKTTCAPAPAPAPAPCKPAAPVCAPKKGCY